MVAVVNVRASVLSAAGCCGYWVSERKTLVSLRIFGEVTARPDGGCCSCTRVHHICMKSREYLNAVHPARWIGRSSCTRALAHPTYISLTFFVWAPLRRFLYEPVVKGDKLLRIQAACDNILLPVFLGECDIQSWIAANCAMKSVVVVTFCTFVVAVLLIPKCLIIVIVCQCYLCTIKVFPANYVWRLQSRFETSFLPLKKTLRAI